MTFPHHPTIRKALPKPFSRPSADLSDNRKREWIDNHPVTDLSPGDIVAGRGKVISVQRVIYRDPYSENIVAKIGEPDAVTYVFAVTERVKAFVVVEG